MNCFRKIMNSLQTKKNEKIKAKQLRIFCKEFGILIESGCDILKSLDLIYINSNKSIKKAIKLVIEQINRGENITNSFKHTNLFSEFFLNMVLAGEVSGSLDKVMMDLSLYYDKEYCLKSKISSILIYPVLLFIMSFISLLVLLLFIIPNFQAMFVQSNIDLPILTKFFIYISVKLRTNYYEYIFTFTIISIFIYICFMRSNYLLMKLEKFKLSIPLLKSIEVLSITTTFSRALEIMISSGVQIIDSIEIASKIVDNKFIENEILKVNSKIKRGNAISDSIESVKVFPTLFISMIKSGEESGNLDISLKYINKFYEKELDINIERSIKLIEPIMIIIIGFIIGLIVISMMTPMFEVISNI